MVTLGWLPWDHGMVAMAMGRLPWRLTQQVLGAVVVVLHVLGEVVDLQAQPSLQAWGG